MSEELENGIKSLLMLDDDVYNQYSSFLTETIENTKSELAILMEEEQVPDPYLFIVKKVVVKRFNKRQSEGVTSASVAEKSTSYQEDDFAEYRDLIQTYVDAKHGNGRPKKGKAVFL